jgi:CBS domain-containing protein
MMQVDDAMTAAVVSVGPGHTLREAARLMSKRNVGAAIVIDGDQPGPGIFTERDLMRAISDGQDPDAETVSEHLSTNLTFAAPDWPLERAAAAMERGGFRHLVVVDGGETVGIISMRDIVRCWTRAAESG